MFSRLPIDCIGAFAEYVAVDAAAVAKTPDYLSDIEAVAVPLTALTAEQALDILKLKSWNSLLLGSCEDQFEKVLSKGSKGVSKRLKGHLLHVNWALIQRQKRVE